MKIKDLKKIIEKMSDDAEVFARNRDCINLEMVDIVGIEKFDIEVSGLYSLNFHKNIKSVYGGDKYKRFIAIKQAIIFCDCD